MQDLTKRFFISTAAALFIIMLSGLLLPHSAMASQHTRERKTQLRANAVKKVDMTQVNERQVLITFKEGYKLTGQEVKELGLEEAKTPGLLKKRGIVLAKIRDEDFDSKLNELRSLPFIESVEPNYIIKAMSVPNDFEFNQQWYLKKIQMPAAWDLYQGNADITVAVLDTGVDSSHEDLAGKVLTGYNSIADNTDTTDDHADRHGTHAAGIIAACTNNGTGIAGIDWNCKILPVKVLDNEGCGNQAALLAGIEYAISQQADVINMSLGGGDFNQDVCDALWKAYNAGIVLAAAAGNEGQPVTFPAAYVPVIGAGATDQDDNYCYFSNYGTGLNLMAPGDNILSTGINSTYTPLSGTSFSAPIVCGAASLLKGSNPNLDASTIEWMMESTAVSSSGTEWDEKYGYGRIDALAALTSPLPDLSEDAGNDKATAVPLVLNKVCEQKLELPQDEDCFYFDVPVAADATVEITAPAGIDVVIKVEGPPGEDGIALGQYESDYGGQGESEVINFSAAAGRYQVYVYEFDGYWSSTPYTIKVSSYVPVSGVVLNQHALTLQVSGAGYKLTANVLPESASEKTVLWGSDKEQIAAVSDGLVTTVSPGTANITARSPEGNNADICVVNVLGENYTPLGYQKTALDNSKKVLTLFFDDSLVNNCASAELKAAVTLAADGQNYISLAPGDKVSISGNTLVINLAAALTGSQNKLKIGANVLTSQFGDKLNNEITTEAIMADGCFIATAAYGSYLDPHVRVLRHFRDNVLLNSFLGSWLVAEYYHYSPPMAAVIAGNEGLRLVARGLLTPVVFAVEYPWGSLLAAMLVMVLLRRRLAKK